MAKSTKFLFLDIDGVLNSHRTILVHNGNPGHAGMVDVSSVLDPIAIGLIQRIARQGVTIVLSSTWRIGLSQAGLARLSEALGIELVAMTPTHMEGVRGEEIKAWLEDRRFDPISMRYVIVDDDTDMLDEQHPNFVKVDDEEGLSFKNYAQICEILELDPWVKYDDK